MSSQQSSAWALLLKRGQEGEGSDAGKVLLMDSETRQSRDYTDEQEYGGSFHLTPEPPAPTLSVPPARANSGARIATHGVRQDDDMQQPPRKTVARANPFLEVSPGAQNMTRMWYGDIPITDGRGGTTCWNAALCSAGEPALA
jgi:hypothetical protein